MTDTDNAYKAKGTSPHEAFDLIAYPGDKKDMGADMGLRHLHQGSRNIRQRDQRGLPSRGWSVI